MNIKITIEHLREILHKNQTLLGHFSGVLAVATKLAMEENNIDQKHFKDYVDNNIEDIRPVAHQCLDKFIDTF